MIKLFLSVTFATALIGSMAYAQTETSSTTTATGMTGQTTTTESFGTVTDFTPGQTIVLRPETGEPTSYKFSKTVTYMTADGRVIDASKVRKDSKVRVHYLKSGDDMLVDKVIVTERD